MTSTTALPSTPPMRAPFALFDPWVWRMAWRDSRRSRGRLLVFSTALTLGVAALVAIGSVGWNLQRAISEQARTLVGADLIVESRHPLTPDAQKLVDSLGGTDRAYETRLVSMATFPRTHGQRLAQVRAMEGGYPFYGKVETDPPEAAAGMSAGKGAVVEESLLLQYSLHVGDEISLGGETFPILGTIRKLPGEVNVFAGIAPRVLIARRLLPAALLSRGSIVRYFTYLQLPPSVSPPQLVADHKAEFEKYHLETDDVDHRKRQMGRVFDDVNHFLSLVSFIALLLGGIGVASAIHAHVKQKLRTVAVLRCLGASSGQTLAIYFLQAISLGVMGSILGAMAGLFFQSLTPLFLKGTLPVELSFAISWESVVEGLIVGFLTCAIFVLLPLLPVRRTPPLLALRAAFETAPKTDRRHDPALWGAWALLIAALLVFPWVQSHNLRLGLGFSAALFVAFGLLALTALGLMAAAKRYFPRRWPFEWRQGVGNLYRPNNRTLLLVFSLGLSTFLLLGMYLTKDVLLRQFSAQGDAATQPNLIFFDIQGEQKEPIAEAVRGHGMAVIDAAATITMRLTSIDGKAAEALADDKHPTQRGDDQDRNDNRWRLRHELPFHLPGPSRRDRDGGGRHFPRQGRPGGQRNGRGAHHANLGGGRHGEGTPPAPRLVDRLGRAGRAGLHDGRQHPQGGLEPLPVEFLRGFPGGCAGGRAVFQHPRDPRAPTRRRPPGSRRTWCKNIRASRPSICGSWWKRSRASSIKRRQPCVSCRFSPSARACSCSSAVCSTLAPGSEIPNIVPGASR